MARKRNRARLGVLFWIAFILFVMVVFLANRANIRHVLETTPLVEVLERRFTGTGVDDDEIALDREESEREPEQDDEIDAEVLDEITEEGPVATEPDAHPEPEHSDDPPPEEAPETASEPEERRADEEREPAEAEDAPSEPREPAEEDVPEPATHLANLYYIRVTEDGAIHPEPIERPIEHEGAPLTQSIRQLVSSPESDHVNAGLLNLVPEDTELLSARVRDGVAYLNFNEAFRFNVLGVEGYIAQLKQIVYSATEFSTVDRVQILIEGQQVEWLGAEGVYIGTPIGRDSFG